MNAKRDSLLDAAWPVKGPDPLPGSILPNGRIIAFYGTPMSKRMGILGAMSPDAMLEKLDQEVAAWRKADPTTEPRAALHLIAVTAQYAPGKDKMFRARAPNAVIEEVASWAKRKDALVFLDVQLGHSTLRDELPRLEPYLKRPNFHLGLDPEFAMKGTARPGKKVGTLDAQDINYATSFLARIVEQFGLPPKVLVVHRFTRAGVTDSRHIKLDPRVQIVVQMDGFGPPSVKKQTYRAYVKAEPVQFTGWKQFYKNDRPRTSISEILRLNPRPLYIQYQ